MNTAWIAGFFDGEGCVHIPSNNTSMQVSITQKDRTELDLIRNWYGFGVVKLKAKKNPCHEFIIGGKRNITIFLRSIRQYSLCKRREIEIGLLYAKTINPHRHGAKGYGKGSKEKSRLPPKIAARREELKNEIKRIRKVKIQVS